MEYEDGMYLGCPLLDDRLFCERVSKLLQENIGRSIEYIGDLGFRPSRLAALILLDRKTSHLPRRNFVVCLLLAFRNSQPRAVLFNPIKRLLEKPLVSVV